MPRLSEQDWQRLLPLLKNIDINRQEAAHRRLVQGMTMVKAGEPFGYSKQDVHGIVKAVLRWLEKLNSVPDKPAPPAGWVTIELMVPRKRVDEVRRVVEALCPAPSRRSPVSDGPESEPSKRRSRRPDASQSTPLRRTRKGAASTA